MLQPLRLAVCLIVCLSAGLSRAQEIVRLDEPHLPDGHDCQVDRDRWFLVSTRHLPYRLCQTPVENPPLEIRQIDGCQSKSLDLAEFESKLSCERPVMIYVHGNRMESSKLLPRCREVFSRVRRYRNSNGIDWVIFSWPSSKLSIGLSDFREKASRCDAQAFYLAWLMRRQAVQCVPMGILSYSFGCRVASGALHVLAGGSIKGVGQPYPPLSGLRVKVAMVAPAIESTWLGNRGMHGLATQNMDELVLLYNHRDAVLKRYWLIEKVRRETALGYSGPTMFAPRFDGSTLPVKSRDCAPTVKLRHSEVDYFKSKCNAGCDISRLINGLQSVAF